MQELKGCSKAAWAFLGRAFLEGQRVKMLHKRYFLLQHGTSGSWAGGEAQLA